MSGLVPGTTYYFRVRAIDGGGPSLSSAVATVVLLPAIPKVRLATNVTFTSFTANWQTSGIADHFYVDVAADSTFDSLVYVNQDAGLNKFLTITGLIGGGSYYYRVRGSNSAGTSLNSSSSQMVITPIDAPIIQDPSSITFNSFVANWVPIAGADAYLVDVSTDATFESLVNEYSAIGSKYVVIGLAPNVTYYYRVRAIRNVNISDFSQITQLTTPPDAEFEIGQGGASGPPFQVTIIPPSPEAAALAKYADVPVSLYSGTPNISLPLFEIKEHELTLPISLSYHASGNKVETIAPRTGLGWVLNAGGMVTRVIRGFPDEHSRGFLDLIQQYPKIDDIWNATDDAKASLFGDLGNGCRDAEPDLFFFNFGGYTGQFMFDWDGKIKIVSGNSIDIKFGINGEVIDSWTITVDDGSVFYFQATEKTEVLDDYRGGSVCNFLLQINENKIPSSWYLTEIRSANQQNWIHFDYDGYTQQNKMWTLETQVHDQFLDPAPRIKQRLVVTNHGQNLKRITVSSGQTVVDFIPSTTSRLDVDSYILYNPGQFNDNYPLAQINVTNRNGKQVKQLDLAYSYSTGRLTLDKITEHVGTVTKPPYLFSYSQTQLPDPLSFKRDHWGFLNANLDSTLIPAFQTSRALDPPHTIVTLEGADRSPSPTLVLAGMLNQITYPTGGKDVFTFEPHDYSFEQRQELLLPIMRKESVACFSPDLSGQLVTATGFPKGSSTTTFVLNKDTTDLHISVTFGRGITNFPGGGGIPSVSINDSRGKSVFYRASLLPVPVTVLARMPSGTYTITCTSTGVPNYGQNTAVAEVTYFSNIGGKATTTEIRQGGGVRIANIKRSFGNGNPDKITVYNYRMTEDGKTKSSGSLLESGLIYEMPMQYGVASGGSINGSGYTTEYKTSRFSQNRSALGTTQGSHVGYSQVTVLQGESGENGRSIYHYDSPREIADGVSFDLPFPPSQSFDYSRGLPLDQTDFAVNSNDTIRHIVNKYSSQSLQIVGLKVGFAVPGGGPYGAGHLERYAVGAYTNQFGYTRLIKTLEQIKHPGQPTLETVKTFDYNETTHKQLIKSSVTNSKGETLVSSFKYPLDYTSPTSEINTMKQLHIDNVPIETLTWKKESDTEVSLLSGVKTDFVINNNGVAPATIHGAKIGNPVRTSDPYGDAASLYEPRLNLLSYDVFNNPHETSKPDGQKTGYQWGYLGTLPTAKVDNASFGQFFYESFEENTAATTDDYKAGKQSLLIAGMYSVPLMNLPSKSGDYILSWWANEGAAWIYHEKLIQNYVAGNISTDPINGYLDEVRLYPKEAMMTTYTYEPLVGITSMTNPANVTTYYEYDDLGRLICIRDQDRNIIQRYDYQFNVEIPYTPVADSQR